MANDRNGPGDFYWIKTFRNDSFLNSISQLNISADMGNTSNGQDGELFIYPVRYNGVNDFLRSFKTGKMCASKSTPSMDLLSLGSISWSVKTKTAAYLPHLRQIFSPTSLLSTPKENRVGWVFLHECRCFGLGYNTLTGISQRSITASPSTNG